MKEAKEEKNNEMLLVQSRRSISAACFTLKEQAERWRKKKDEKKNQKSVKKWEKDKKTERVCEKRKVGSSGG